MVFTIDNHIYDAGISNKLLWWYSEPKGTIYTRSDESPFFCPPTKIWLWVVTTTCLRLIQYFVRPPSLAMIVFITSGWLLVNICQRFFFIAIWEDSIVSSNWYEYKNLWKTRLSMVNTRITSYMKINIFSIWNMILVIKNGLLKNDV